MSEQRQQNQAEQNLQALSLQLTHYLNDWVFDDGYCKGHEGLSRNGVGYGKRRDKDGKECKQSKLGRQRVQIGRIQFPVMQTPNESTTTPILPPIKRPLNPHDISRLAHLHSHKATKSEQKLSRYPTPEPQPSLRYSHTLERHQHEILLKIKRMRKRSRQGRNLNPENLCKRTVQIDVGELKAMVVRELKNNRRSGKKEDFKGN